MDDPGLSNLTAMTDSFTRTSALSAMMGSTTALLMFLHSTILRSESTPHGPQQTPPFFVSPTTPHNPSYVGLLATNLPRRCVNLRRKYGFFDWAHQRLINLMSYPNSPPDFPWYLIIIFSGLLTSRSRLVFESRLRNDPPYGPQTNDAGSIWILDS
jgi:hypothetical protein